MTMESTLTESQKLRAIATAADCPEDAPFDVVVAAVRELVRDSRAFKRMVFTALGEMNPKWIDAAMSNMMARAPKKSIMNKERNK